MPGGMELKNEVLAGPACSLCGACLDWCPFIKNIEDRIAIAFDCVCQEGRCYSVCPRTMTDWEDLAAAFTGGEASDAGNVMEIWKARAAMPAAGKQDGGTVSALVETALATGLGSAALLTGSADGVTPEPKLVKLPEEVRQNAGSRFLSAPSFRKLIEAAKGGEKALTAVGRPCQIQALRKLQAAHPEQLGENVTAIGLFCMWSLSWRFQEAVARMAPGLKIKRITIPQHGVEVETDQGVLSIPTAEARGMVSPGCAYCLDMTAELADISVGALEAEPGWNTVLIRSPRGKALFERAVGNGAIEVMPYPMQEFERLKSASTGKKIRAAGAIQAAAGSGRIKPFVDLAKPVYQALGAAQEGQVNG
ncbi:MAG: Coenzyme F420 hydrogenase/dehydrogenase, beta subunit C-terminal domain [Solirubrobacterales bacterium]